MLNATFFFWPGEVATRATITPCGSLPSRMSQPTDASEFAIPTAHLPLCLCVGRNANYLERLLIPARIPVDPVFMPRVGVRLRDFLFGGLLSPIIATGDIDLAQKVSS